MSWVERFVAGWFAARMPREGIRPCGLTPWEENATVVIYCGNHVGLFVFLASLSGEKEEVENYERENGIICVMKGSAE